MKIKCLLVDDEPLAIKLLQNHLQQLNNFEVVATCSNAAKAYDILRTTDIDLLFLDIKMPQLSGIDFLKTLRRLPVTIITTAYREFALEGYELGVIDYLLKPISFERLLKAVDRFRILHQPAPAAPAQTEETYIVVKSGNKYQRIAATDVYYIESLKDYVKIYTTHKEIVAKYSISELENEINDKGFIRIHRSFIINIKKVTAFSGNGIEMEKFEVPVGASYKELVKKLLKFE